MCSSDLDRLTPSAMIPMHTPEEAIRELEFAVKELHFKSVTIASEVRRPVPEVLKEAPHLAKFTQRVYSLTVDSPYDYDPFWAKCVELRVAPTAHSGSQTTARRQSQNNFVYNRLGSFGVGGEHLCRSMFLSGVPRRFPTLNVGFLEGGVAWACALYNDLFEFWEKRNVGWLKEHMDPAKLDMELMTEMFERFGDAGRFGRRGVAANDGEQGLREAAIVGAGFDDGHRPLPAREGERDLDRAMRRIERGFGRKPVPDGLVPSEAQGRSRPGEDPYRGLTRLPRAGEQAGVDGHLFGPGGGGRFEPAPSQVSHCRQRTMA